jgi:putative tryptophan/tyrosine transport system substrate-binding protein
VVIGLGERMRRRDIIRLVGGLAGARLLAARAQQQMRRIVLLQPATEDDPDARSSSAAFEQGLVQRGWVNGRDVRIDVRWGLDNADKVKAAISELQTHPPDVVVASTSQTVAALRRAMPTLPLVFVFIYDPVAEGFVQSLAHPGGNATGFTAVESSIGTKWLQLLAEMTPGLARVAYMCNPNNPGPLQPYPAAQAAGRDLRVEVTLAGVHGAADIETAMRTLAREPGGGLIVPPDGFLVNHRKMIIELAERERVRAIYGFASFVAQGGLASYGVKLSEQFSQAAIYVDRLLPGEKPGDLPVQEPTHYALVINLKAAKTLGLNVSPSLLATADEVIE